MLAALPAMGYRVMVIPGGGPTDNTIECMDRVYHFHPDTHHRACARAQDQTGLMICDPSVSGTLSACESLEEARRSLDAGDVAVLLPSRLIFALDPFERTWEITSDAMAAYFAWLVRCNRLLILTDVDGIYRDGAIGDPTKLVRRMTASELIPMGQTAVDSCTGPFIGAHGITAWVLNGAYPERVLSALRGEDVLGTRIESDRESVSTAAGGLTNDR
jgi:aspartokinase-like uncharacterized kinase